MPNYPRLRELMARRGADAVVAATRENLIYFTGFDPVIKALNPYHGHCYAVILRDGPEEAHVVHALGEADQILDATQALGRARLYGVFYREGRAGARLSPDDLRLQQLMHGAELGVSPVAALGDLLEDLGLGRAQVALDEDGAPSGVGAALEARGVQITAGSALIRTARQVKTPEEVARLTVVARATEAAIAVAAAAARPGTSELEIARHFEIALAERRVHPALTMLKVGRGAVGGQRRQRSDVVVRPGDLLWFDCDAICDGYWSDIARVYAVGPPGVDVSRYEALHAGQAAAIDRIRPGMTGDDAFRLTMEAVHAAGFPEYRRHHVGHGIGLEPYERPILAPGNTDVIEVGMILSVETPYYEFGLGALHVEDPIRVGPTANERLTADAGNLIILDSKKLTGATHGSRF